MLETFRYHGIEVIDMSFGENLRNLRRAGGLSQDDVAQKLFVSRQSVSKWENGQAEPGVENLKVLSQLYGVTVDELVGNTRDGEREECGLCPYDLFQLTVMLRLFVALYSICFVAKGLLLYCWELPLLFAGFRFQSRFLWGTTLTLGGASLFVHLIGTAKAFWCYDYYRPTEPFQWLFVTVGIALTLILLLQRKTRLYYEGSAQKEAEIP